MGIVEAVQIRGMDFEGEWGEGERERGRDDTWADAQGRTQMKEACFGASLGLVSVGLGLG